MRKVVMVIVAVCLAGNTAFADATTELCDRRCRQPQPSGKAFVIVDANTGQVLGGATRYNESTNVEFIIVNKNPFKYRYRFDLSARPLEHGIAFDFLSTVANMQIPASIAGLAGGGSCSNPAVATFKNTVTEAVELRKAIRDEAAGLIAAAKQLATFLTLTEADKIDCVTACVQAAAVRPSAARLSDLSKLQGNIKSLETKLTEAQAQFAIANTVVAALTGTEKPDCVTDLGAAQKTLENLNKEMDQFGETMTSIEKASPGAKMLGRIIDGLDDTAFHEVRYGTAAGDTRFTLAMYKQNLRIADSQEAKTAEITVDAGRTRLGISGGIGFTTLEDVTVVRQRGADPADATKVREVFAEENTSSFRPSPIVVINANIGAPFDFFGVDSAPALFSWSLGVLLASRSDNTQAEFVTGPSIGFLDNNVVFTFGYHGARVERLGGGFKVGDPIPSSLQDPLPVQHEWKGGFLFGVTYRFR